MRCPADGLRFGPRLARFGTRAPVLGLEVFGLPFLAQVPVYLWAEVRAFVGAGHLFRFKYTFTEQIRN